MKNMGLDVNPACKVTIPPMAYPRGVWEDSSGALHFDVPLILEESGVKDTPAERERVAVMLREILKKQLPKARVILLGDQTDHETEPVSPKAPTPPVVVN